MSNHSPTSAHAAPAQVLIRKAEGKTYGQVAYELGVSEQTVKNHLGLAYARLGAEHLIEALRILGWLRLPGESDVTQAA